MAFMSREEFEQQYKAATDSGLSKEQAVAAIGTGSRFANKETASQPVQTSPTNSGFMSREQFNVQYQDAINRGLSKQEAIEAIGNSARTQNQLYSNLRTSSLLRPEDQPTRLQEVADKVLRPARTAIGAAEQYLGSHLQTAASYYEGATRGSQADYERLGELAKKQVQEAHASYKSALEKAQYNMDDKDVQRAKRMLDSAISERRMYQTATADSVKRDLADISQKFYSAADKVSNAGAQTLERAKRGTGFWGGLAVDVGSGALQMAGDIATGKVFTAPGTAVNILPIMAARTFGSGAAEARNAGASYERQVAAGGASAIIEVMTEKLGDVTKLAGGGALDDIIETTIRHAANTPAGMTALRLASAFTSEAIEEIVSGVADPFVKSIYDGGEARKEAFSSGANIWNFAKETLYEGLIGGILGLGGTARAQIAYGSISLENSKARVANDAESRLIQRGFDKKAAGNLAELVSQQLSGEELSSEQEAELAKWPTAQEVLSEMQKEGVKPTDKYADKRLGNILAKHKATRADEKVIARAASANLNALEQHELGAIYEAAYRQGDTALCERVLEEQARRVNEVFSKMSRGEVLDLTADQKALYEKIRRQLRNPAGNEQGRPDLYDENTPPASDAREQQQVPMYIDEEAPPARAVPDYMREESAPPAPAQQVPTPAQEQQPAQQPVAAQEQNQTSKRYLGDFPSDIPKSLRAESMWSAAYDQVYDLAKRSGKEITEEAVRERYNELAERQRRVDEANEKYLDFIRNGFFEERNLCLNGTVIAVPENYGVRIVNVPPELASHGLYPGSRVPMFIDEPFSREKGKQVSNPDYLKITQIARYSYYKNGKYIDFFLDALDRGAYTLDEYGRKIYANKAYADSAAAQQGDQSRTYYIRGKTYTVNDADAIAAIDKLYPDSNEFERAVKFYSKEGIEEAAGNIQVREDEARRNELLEAVKKRIEQKKASKQSASSAPDAKKPVKKGKMVFDYGNGKRPNIKAANTFDAVLDGTRTSTTRLMSQHGGYWAGVRVGDVVEFSDGKGRTVLVEVTSNPRMISADADGNFLIDGRSMTNAEYGDILEKEGWTDAAFKRLILNKVKGGDSAVQFEYKLYNPQSANPAPSTTSAENDTIVEESDYYSEENERLIEEGNDVYNRLVNFLENGPEDEAFQEAGGKILDPLTNKLMSFERNRYNPYALRQLMERAEAFMKGADNGREQAVQQPEQPARGGEGTPGDASVEGRGEERLGDAVRGEPGQPVYSTADSGGAGSASDAGEVGSSAGSQGDQRSQREGARDEAAEQVTWAKRQETASVLSDKGESRRIVGEGQDALDSPDGRIVKVSENCEEIVSPRKGSIAHFIKYMFKVFGASGRNGHIYTARFNITDADGNPTGINASGVNCGDEVAVAINERANALKRKEELETAGHEVSHKRMSDMFGSGKARASIDSSGNVVVERRAEKAYSITMDALTRFYGSRQSAEVMYNAIANYYLRASSTNYLKVYNNDGSVWAYQTTTWITEAQVEEALRKHVIEEFLVECCGHGNKIRKMANDGIINYSDIDRLETAVMDAMRRSKVLTWSQERVLREMRRLTSEDKINRSFSDFITGKFERVGRKSTRISNRDTGTEFRLAESLNAILDKLNADNSPDKSETSDLGDFTDYELRAVLEYCMEGIPAGGKTTVERIANQLLGVNSTNDIVNTDLVVAGDKKMQTRLRVLRAVLEELDLRGEDISKESSLWRFHRFSTSESELSPESDPEDIVAAIQDGDENLEKDIMFGNGDWSSLDVNERLAILNENPDQSYYDAGNDRIGKEGMFGLEDPEYSKDPRVRSEMDIEQRQGEFDDTLDNDSEQKYDEEKKASDLDALIKTTEYERKRAAGEPVSWSEDAEVGSNFVKGTIPVPKEWNGWVKRADISEEEYEEARQILEDSKRSNELNSTLHKLQTRLAELQRFSNALAGNLVTESDSLKSKVRNYRLAAQDYMELVDSILSENPDNSLAARYYGNATVLNTLASQLEYQLLTMRSEYMNNKGAKMVSGNIKAVLDAIEIVSNELTSKDNPMSPEVLEEYGFDQKAVEGRRRRENWAKRTVHQHDEMGQYLRDSDGNYIVPDAENSARGYSQEMTELEEPTRDNSKGVPPPVKYESRNTAKTHARAKSSEAAKADSALSNRYSGGQDTDFLEARNRRVEAARKEEQAKLDAAFNEKLKNRKPRNKDAYKGFDFAREMSRNGTSSGYEQEDISSGYGIDKGFSNSTFGKKNVFASGYSEDSGVSLSTSDSSGSSGTALEKMCANIIEGKGTLFESSTDADQAPAHDDTDDPKRKLTKEEQKIRDSRFGDKPSAKPVTPEVSQAMLHLQEDVTGILKSDTPVRHVLSLAESLTSYQAKDSEMNWLTSKEINDTVREIQDAYKMAEEDVDAKAQRMANATAKLLALVSNKVERAEINRADEFAFEEAAEKNGKEATNAFGKARYFHDSWRFNPTTQFKMIDGFDKNSNGVGYRRAKQIENSVAKEQMMTGDVFTRYAALQNEKGIQEFAEGKSMCQVPVPGLAINGKPIGKITEQQAVELIKTIRTLAYQEVGSEHRLDTIAGFTFVDKNGNEVSIKRKDLKSSKESSFYQDMLRLATDMELTLSPAAKKYMEITDGILFDVGNEVSKVKQQVTGVGFDKFQKGYYYPVRYRSPAHQTDYTDSYERGGLFDPFTDRTKTTGGYVYIGSAADTVDNYIRNAIYAASYADLSDTLDFMNSTALGMRGMANVVGDNYGKSFARAFNNYTNDVAQRFDKDSSGFNQMMGKARSLLQQGALRFSVSVPIKQTASYWDAMGTLSPEALREAYRFKATKAKGYGKGNPILDVRTVGGIDPTLSEILNNKGYLSDLKKKSKIADAWDKAISVMDYRTVDDLYHACIIDTKLSYPDLDVNSKMFKDIVSMKFQEVVLNTQPVFNANARSQAARTKNELVRMVSMFQTQQTQNYNRLVTAIGEAKAAGTQLDPIAKRTLRRTVAGQVAAVVEFSLLQMLADLALHRKKQYKEDDDDKADAGKVLGRFLMNAIESAAGTVWLGDQAAKLAIDFVTGDSSNTSGEFRGPSLGPVSSAMSAVDNVVSAADSIRDAIVKRDLSKLNASSIRYGITNTAQLFGIPANNVASAINSIAMYGLDAAYTLSGGKRGNRLGEDKFVKIVNSWIKGDMTVDGAKRQVNKALKREQPENVLYNVGILEAEGAARAKKNGTDDPHSGRDYLSSRLKKIGANGDTPNERIVNYLISSKLSDTEIDKAVDSYVTAYSYNALYDAARKTGMSPKAVVKALDEIDANGNGDIAKSELKDYYKQHGGKSNKLVEALWGAKDYKTIIPDDGEYEKFTVHYDAVMNTGVSAARASSIVDACKNDQGSITQGAIYQYYLAHPDDEEQIKALFESMGYKQNGKAKTWDWFKKNYKPK